MADSQRKKLDSKTEKMILVGYSRSPKGYRLYNPSTHKIYIRRDVIFNEKDFYRSSQEPITPSSETLEISSENVMRDVDSDDKKTGPERTQRERRAPVRYGYDEFADVVHYALNVNTLKEALASEDGKKWKAAADVEFNSLQENDTWDLVEVPQDAKIIDSKWVFKVKPSSDGSSERFKARLVARGLCHSTGTWH